MKTLYKFLSWIITIFIPVVIVMSVARMLFTPTYLVVEYHMPGFPADTYGFSLQDRIKYGGLAVDYLNNSAGISFLSSLRFPQGQQAPPSTCIYMTDCTQLFSDSELQHMVDVKVVYKTAIHVLEGSVIILALFALWAWRGRWLKDYMKGLQRGGLLTVILLGAIVLFILAAFNVFFVLFHEIFFKPGTWMFLYSDTLIRLFPERFWQDTFLYGTVLSVVIGLLFFFGFRKIQFQKTNLDK